MKIPKWLSAIDYKLGDWWIHSAFFRNLVRGMGVLAVVVTFLALLVNFKVVFIITLLVLVLACVVAIAVILGSFFEG